MDETKPDESVMPSDQSVVEPTSETPVSESASEEKTSEITIEPIPEDLPPTPAPPEQNLVIVNEVPVQVVDVEVTPPVVATPDIVVEKQEPEPVIQKETIVQKIEPVVDNSIFVIPKKYLRAMLQKANEAKLKKRQHYLDIIMSVFEKQDTIRIRELLAMKEMRKVTRGGIKNYIDLLEKEGKIQQVGKQGSNNTYYIRL